MTEKSVLERLREDLAKVCEQQIDTDERRGRLQARSILDRCAATIRAHDLSIYESAPQQESEMPTSGLKGKQGADPAGAADPDVVKLISKDCKP